MEKNIREVKTLTGLEGIKELLIKWETEAIAFHLEEARLAIESQIVIDEKLDAFRKTTTDYKAIDRFHSQLAFERRDRFTQYIRYLVAYRHRINDIIIDTITADMQKEAVKKYYALVARITKITGEEIVEISNMNYNYGDINGLIKGTKGTAKITTIDAGGYNIQCYHFRVLVKEVK